MDLRLPARPVLRRGARRLPHALGALAIVTTVLVTASVPASAGPNPVMRGYVPLPADEFQLAQESINTAATTTIDFTVGITNAGDGAVIYYDHWEDGFEADAANPVQTSTEVWGDGNTGNGDASSLCAPACAGDLLTAGDVFVLRNTFTTPRDAGIVAWDGRDKVSSTRGFSLTAGGFSSVGSVFAGSASAYDTSKYGTQYVVPVGQDSVTPSGTTPAFEYTGVVAMAAADDTTVQFDTDGDGDVDSSQSIDEGEVAFVNGGVMEGATVSADQPVQVQLVTGDVGATYESRWFTLFPTPLLSSDYLNPVGSSNDNQRTISYLFNPGTSAITVTPSCTSCSGTLAIPAGEGVSFPSPLGEAVRFAESGGAPFVAIGAMGSQSGAAPGSGTDNSSVYDWGFSLVPTGLLTTQVVLGWAPGNSTNPPGSAPSGNYDDDPVWVTTLSATTIHVDYDGDPSTGSMGADCVGAHDAEISVGALVSTRIVDTSDGDMTGARIYTCDGTDISGAWGEDPASAPTGAPGFDAGYALIPSTAMVVDKTAGLTDDTNGDGRIGPGDEIEYRVDISDAGSLAFTNVSINDGLGVGLSYVAGSTTFDGGSGVVAITDDTVGPAATVFPLDESGHPVPDIAAGETVTFRYRVVIDDAALATGVTSVSNSVSVVADEADADDTLVTALATSDLSLTKSLTTTPTYVGDTAVFRITVANAGPDAAVGVEVTDAVPAGTTFDSATASTGSYDDGTGVWSIPTLASGASATLDISLDVTATSVTNVAEVTASGSIDPDSQPAENALGGGSAPDQDDEDSETFTVLPSADLSLTKTRTAGPAADGTTTFRITLANDGPSTATGVAVTDTPPAGSTFDSATASVGAFDDGTGVWSVASLASGASATLDLTYVITTAPSVNSAEVTASDQHDPDSSPAENALDGSNPPDEDDEAQASVPGLAGLSLAKSPTTTPTHTGDTVVWDVVVSNAGPHAAASVVVRDQLPAGLALLSATGTQGSYDSGTGDWTVGTVAASGSATLTITAVVTAPGSITNTAQVWSSATTDPDSTPANSVGSEDDQDSSAISTTAATVGDLVFHDVDGDGTRDVGEPGIAGADVTVRWAGPNGTLGDGDDVVRTDTTDASGGWSVVDLPSGVYRVSVDPASLPAGMTTPTADRDGTGTANQAGFTLSGGADLDDVDFGYRGAGIVGDTVFDDADGDATFDSGEGLAGVDVIVTWYGLDGNAGGGDDVVVTSTTDATGAWGVVGLPDGTVHVEVDTATLPAGLSISVDPDGGSDGESVVTFSGGGTDLDQDFGYEGGGIIGDAVWSDTDGDGTQDSGEPGLGAVQLTLTRDVDLNGSYETTVRSALSSGSGSYAFGGLAPGEYRVTATTPSGQTATTPVVVDVTLGASQTRSDVDFGFEPPAPPTLASVGDLVWDDVDGDGTQDVGEPGLSGVTVTLRLDGDGNGSFETTVVSMTTDANGAYGFANLPPGAYQVVVSVPTGRTASTPANVSVPVAAGDVITNVDVGLTGAVVATGTVGDLVWDDTDVDGVADGGELGLDGVTVTLRSDPDGDGVFDAVVGTQVTAGGGAYQFTGVAPGTYRVVVTVPGGTFPSTATSLLVGVGAGAAVTDADFGLAPSAVATGSIGDRVWSDTDADGVQDVGEPGVNGVTVTLRADLDGDGSYESTVGTTTTAGDGGYSFTGLAPGAYLVSVTAPAGMSATTASQHPVALSAGEDDDGADVGLASSPNSPFDLRLEISANGDPTTGGSLTWTVQVANAGLTPSPDPLTVTTVLPSGVTYVSATGAGWACGAAGQTVTCTRTGSLSVGASDQVRLLTSVSASPGTQLQATATVAAAGIEVTLANNSDVAGVTALAAPTTTTSTTTTVPVEQLTPVSDAGQPLAATGLRTLLTVALALMALGGGIYVFGFRRLRGLWHRG